MTLFLQKNKGNIPDIASNIVKNIPALSTLTKEMGVSDDLIRDSAKLGTDLAPLDRCKVQ
jgi:hypothetical protein